MKSSRKVSIQNQQATIEAQQKQIDDIKAMIKKKILTIMKTIKTLLAALLITTGAFAQNVGINSDGSVPDSSVLFEVSSTAKGFLVSQMTAEQHIAINLPAAGLVSSKLMILLVFFTILGPQDTLEC